MSPKASFVRIGFAFLAVAIAFAFTYGAPTADAAPVKLPQIPTPPTPPSIPTPPQPIAPPSRPLNPIEMEFAERFKKLVEEAAKEELPELKQENQETFDEFVRKLLDEFGPDARFGMTPRFVVIYDTTDAYALWCATLMENVASTYEAFVSRVRLVEDGLSDPMVVFIFAEKEKYEEFLKKTAGSEFANDAQFPVGFYEHASNRCVFFDLTGEEQNRADKEEKRTLEQVASDVLKQPNGDQNLSTIIHEGTHLVAFNYGLFSRQGENPSWAVEGLSMLFEAPSGEPKDGGWKVVDEKAKKIVFPINKRRLMEFQQYVSTTTDAATSRALTLFRGRSSTIFIATTQNFSRGIWRTPPRFSLVCRIPRVNASTSFLIISATIGTECTSNFEPSRTRSISSSKASIPPKPRSRLATSTICRNVPSFLA